MAEKWKAALKEKGPTAVGMFGSRQWTVWEGYAASKLYQAGFRSNNLEPNARHCMASAVAGFIRTFGSDEPMGCYDDLEHADAFVLWGSNMAEMHPVLWSRLTDRRLTSEGCKVAVLSTFKNRNFDLADIGIVFTPQTDLAILNYIARHIIKTGRVNQEFVDAHVKFARGKDLEALAELYANPDIKVVSYWTMEFNQHTRGTWANNMVYNIHLLTGKISEPGNGPFSLTGQPSACGTAREVGAFAHRRPNNRTQNLTCGCAPDGCWNTGIPVP